MDETYALPTEEAASLALRTQQVIAAETNVADVADPLGGSWYLEQLTDKMEAEATRYMEKIDDMGGIVRAVELGFPQHEIADSAFQDQKRVDSGDRKIVGINCHVEDGADPIPTLAIDPEVESGQVRLIKEVRANRDSKKVEAALAAVHAACAGDANLMPPILDAVKAEVTLGEICDVFREEFGVYRDPAYV
jgi:methylmalonyl-CoA mutase N-terminal domain/subunit